MSDEEQECQCEDREDVYDSHISPLVAEILELCRAARIPVVFAFGLSTDEDPELMVTSAAFGGDCPTNDKITIAYHVLTGDTSPLLQAATRRTES